MTMPGHLNAYSPGRIMKVRDLESTAVQIDVQALQLVIDAAEQDKPRPKQSLASALGKTAGGGLTSMLQVHSASAHHLQRKRKVKASASSSDDDKPRLPKSKRRSAAWMLPPLPSPRSRLHSSAYRHRQCQRLLRQGL